MNPNQWRIQDFPNGGRPPEWGGRSLLNRPIYTEKLHENWKILLHMGGARRLRPRLDPPLQMYSKHKYTVLPAWLELQGKWQKVRANSSSSYQYHQKTYVISVKGKIATFSIC